jgi:hypothetical protein
VERRLEGREHGGRRGPDSDRAREPSLRARLALVAIAGIASTGAQCQGNPSVSFEILLPSAVANQAQWMEIGVLPGSCPAPDQLAAGLPEGATLVRVAFQKGDTSPPAIGDLKRGSYAFAAVARAADCSVVATGCTEADVDQARDVRVALSATQTPVGACAPGESCSTGRCAPSTSPGDPTVGAGCSMDLVGAGPLGDPLELSGTEVASAPAVAVTETGFLLAYREYDASQGVARLTVGALDPGGSLTLNAPTTLPAQCPNQNETDGVGLAYLGGAGVVLSARPACGQQPGLDALQVDASGNVKQTAFSPTGAQPALSSTHAASPTGAGSGWVAVLEQGAPSLLPLAGLQVQGSGSRFGGAPPQSLAEVAATDQAVALLAGGGGTLTLQLGVTPADAGAANTLAGTWGAVAAEASRALVLSNGGGTGGQPLAFHAYDVGGSGASASGTFAPPGQGTVAGGDVALHGDRAMFALEQPGAVSIMVYDHASTTPSPLRSVLLSADARVPAQTTVRDGRVAIAASDSRVLVTWITAINIGPNDPVGGYALYACAP